MKVIVEVTGGRNKGKKFDLTQLPTDDAHYILCEDDVLLFSVLTKELIPTIHLALHEVFMPPNDGPYPPTEFRPYYEYRWEPKPIRFGDKRKESFFHNFCGLAELLVVDRMQTTYDAYDIEILQQLQPIEVLARKINADRINAMLDFLARNDGRDLAALTRITRKYSGFKEGDKTIAFTLDRIEKYLSFLEESLPKIVRKPIVKMVSRNTIKPYSRHSNITEDSINHIISSPEGIYEVLSGGDALFKFDDRFFAVDTILETEVVEETDLYENQVLHGFVEVLLMATNDILKKLGEIKVKRNSDILGYESLFNKLNQFNARLNQPCIDRCVGYIRQFSKIKRILADRVKVKKIITSEPHFTHKAKQNITYHQIFLMMIEWSRFGTPDWSLKNELNSIQDISKLFEFYLFCVTKEHVMNCSQQFHGGLIESPIDGTNDSRFVFQVNEQIRAELLYEPNIFYSINQDDALLPLYTNTEAWKNKTDTRNLPSEYDSYSRIRDKYGFLLRVDGSRVQKMYRMRRAPDIVLRLMNGDQESLLIMDAKYMTTHKAFHVAMPECAMKYLHGIHIGATGQNNSIGLMIVNPDEDDLTIHYHHNEYSIFGNRPVTPAIMTAAIDVAHAHNLGSTIQKNIFRLMELMALKISENGLGEQKINLDAIYKTLPDQQKLIDLPIAASEITARSITQSESKKIQINVVKKEVQSNQSVVNQTDDSVDQPIVDTQVVEPVAVELKAVEAPSDQSLVQTTPVEVAPKFKELKSKPISLKRKVNKLGSKDLLNFKSSHFNGSEKKARKSTMLEQLEKDKHLTSLQQMSDLDEKLNNMNIEGSYANYDHLPDIHKLREILNQSNDGSVSDLYESNRGVVFPEMPIKHLDEIVTFQNSLKDNELINEDAFSEFKLRFFK